MFHRLVSLLAVASLVPATAQQPSRTPPPEPDHANVAYGPHARNVMDVWLARSERPTPVVIYIHGGGFRAGDKRSIGAGNIGDYRQRGWSVAAINYRFTDTAPAPAAYLDCARAIQFLRFKAKEWNLDKRRIASTGGSAGAGTSLWLAFHDDLAAPGSDDPVARESTRLTCVAVDGGQCSYDPRFVAAFGIPRPNFELHPFFLPFYGIKESEINSAKAQRLYEEMAPITYLTRDDPPALLSYSGPDRDADPREELGLVVHHPRFGIALKERMDKLGIECIVQYRAGDQGPIVRHGNGAPVQRAEFIARQFQKVAPD